RGRRVSGLIVCLGKQHGSEGTDPEQSLSVPRCNRMVRRITCLALIRVPAHSTRTRTWKSQGSLHPAIAVTTASCRCSAANTNTTDCELSARWDCGGESRLLSGSPVAATTAVVATAGATAAALLQSHATHTKT